MRGGGGEAGGSAREDQSGESEGAAEATSENKGPEEQTEIEGGSGDGTEGGGAEDGDGVPEQSPEASKAVVEHMLAVDSEDAVPEAFAGFPD